jgi:CHAD domain-containing protein
MLVQEFKNYYIERESGVTGHFMSASENGNENAIHELRVEIKKIRAFLDLIKGITPYFDLKKTYQPIKSLFKAAAPIRDAQVLQTMTREYISEVGLDVNLSEYFNILKQKEMSGRKEFLKFSKKFDMSVFRKTLYAVEKALAVLTKSDEDKIRTYSKGYLQSLFNILDDLKNKSVLEEKDFHYIRILCKKTRYTLEILSDLFSPESFELMNNSLKLVHQPLGQWHDTDAAIALINAVLSDDYLSEQLIESEQSIKPLFSESSYNDMLQSFKVRKQHFNDLFLRRFKSLDLTQI